MLQLHPELNLLHSGAVHNSVQMPQHRPAVKWVLLLGLVKEPGAAYAVPHYGDGPVRELPARHGCAHHQRACFTPARPGDIFCRGRGEGSAGGASSRRNLRYGGGGGSEKGGGKGTEKGRRVTRRGRQIGRRWRRRQWRHGRPGDGAEGKICR